MDSDIGDDEAAAKIELPALLSSANSSVATLTMSATARLPNLTDIPVTIITPRTATVLRRTMTA